jgi:hypothetical protein
VDCQGRRARTVCLADYPTLASRDGLVLATDFLEGWRICGPAAGGSGFAGHRTVIDTCPAEYATWLNAFLDGSVGS